jgi:hypothetical protein
MLADTGMEAYDGRRHLLPRTQLPLQRVPGADTVATVGVAQRSTLEPA